MGRHVMPLPTEKRCPRCEAVKPIDDFAPNRPRALKFGENSRSARQGYCRCCMREYQRVKSAECKKVGGAIA